MKEFYAGQRAMRALRCKICQQRSSAQRAPAQARVMLYGAALCAEERRDIRISADAHCFSFFEPLRQGDMLVELSPFFFADVAARACATAFTTCRHYAWFHFAPLQTKYLFERPYCFISTTRNMKYARWRSRRHYFPSRRFAFIPRVFMPPCRAMPHQTPPAVSPYRHVFFSLDAPPTRR